MDDSNFLRVAYGIYIPESGRILISRSVKTIKQPSHLAEILDDHESTEELDQVKDSQKIDSTLVALAENMAPDGPDQVDLDLHLSLRIRKTTSRTLQTCDDQPRRLRNRIVTTSLDRRWYLRMLPSMIFNHTGRKIADRITRIGAGPWKRR